MKLVQLRGLPETVSGALRDSPTTPWELLCGYVLWAQHPAPSRGVFRSWWRDLRTGESRIFTSFLSNVWEFVRLRKHVRAIQSQLPMLSVFKGGAQNPWTKTGSDKDLFSLSQSQTHPLSVDQVHVQRAQPLPWESDSGKYIPLASERCWFSRDHGRISGISNHSLVFLHEVSLTQNPGEAVMTVVASDL